MKWLLEKMELNTVGNNATVNWTLATLNGTQNLSCKFCVFIYKYQNNRNVYSYAYNVSKGDIITEF